MEGIDKTLRDSVKWGGLSTFFHLGRSSFFLFFLLFYLSCQTLCKVCYLRPAELALGLICSFHSIFESSRSSAEADLLPAKHISLRFLLEAIGGGEIFLHLRSLGLDSLSPDSRWESDITAPWVECVLYMR